MKIRDALKELKKIADGRYCSVGYEINVNKEGEEDAECSVYVAGPGYFKSKTFRGALNELRGAGEREEEQEIDA